MPAMRAPGCVVWPLELSSFDTVAIFLTTEHINEPLGSTTKLLARRCWRLRC